MFLPTEAEAKKLAEKSSSESDIEENVNRLQPQGETARNIDEAIHVLG